MGRRPCCSKEGVNRGAWSALEDSILTSYIQAHGEGKWRDLPKRAGLRRCGKSCRLRWLNYLRPDIKRGNISPEEEDLIIRLHNLLGNRWSLIAGRLPGRTDNEIKNYWNTCLSKRTMDGQSSKASTQKRIKRRQSTSMGCESETHQVIRTKAVRCTKVFLPSPQRDITPLPTPLEDDCLNFLMDFDMGQLFASDHMLDTDHLQSIQEKSIRFGDDGGNNVLSSGIDEPLSFSEDLLDDWREITAIQDGLGLELELLDLSLIKNEVYPN